MKTGGHSHSKGPQAGNLRTREGMGPGVCQVQGRVGRDETEKWAGLDLTGPLNFS